MANKRVVKYRPNIRMRVVRSYRNLSIRQLALLVDMRAMTLTDMEKGLARAPRDMGLRTKIASALGVRRQWLFDQYNCDKIDGIENQLTHI